MGKIRRILCFAALVSTLGLTTLAAAEEAETETVSKALHFASDWNEIYEALQSAEQIYPEEVYYVEDIAADMAYESSSDTASAKITTAGNTTDNDYSTTNLRDINVDEADIVKTDGSYIYMITDQKYLTIVRADQSDSELVSISRVGQSSYETDWRLETDEADADGADTAGGVQDLVGYDAGITVTPKEMYVDGDRLILIRSKENRVVDPEYSYTRYQTVTLADTYDISDRAHPYLLGSVEQQGSYHQSRKNEDIIYLYSTDRPDVDYTLAGSSLGVTVNGQQLEPEQFCIPDLVTDSEYFIMSSVSLENPSATIDQKVYVSGGDNCYVTTDSLYVLTSYYHYRSSSSKTEIAAFDTEDGRILGRGAVTLRGYVNDTWSIDAYNGYVRVLTTYTGPSRSSLIEILQNMTSIDEYFEWYDDQTWTRHNALYVLNKDLERTGVLYDIARNEEIKSARYFGDRVYFVTYENTDPVFCADLSDPADPRIIGELKVTGFSSYLHPYGDGQLLGIGYETDENTGSTLGLKFSMFGVEEDGSVTELARVVLPGITWVPALNDYKAIFVSPEKNLIGLYYDERYMVYSYDEELGFNRELMYDYLSDDLAGTTDYSRIRALYIGDELYLAGGTSVVGFDMLDEFRPNLVLAGFAE